LQKTTREERGLPNVQTNDEAGLGGFPARPWWGIAAPAGTPPAIVARLNADFNAVFRDPKMLELMDARYVEAAVTTPAEFAAFLKIDRVSAVTLVRLASQAPR
jgi:tripartite-type tricarboxylate transporter receptor subunit TctC